MANPLGAPRLAVCGIVVAALIVLHGTRASAAHPLDSLSSEEIAAAVAVLREAGDIDAATRFALIDLDEPPKAEVLAWKPAQPFIRKAFIVARRDRTVYEAVVDLGARKVERWEPVPNVQSGLVVEELEDAGRITRADPGQPRHARVRRTSPAWANRQPAEARFSRWTGMRSAGTNGRSISAWDSASA
jgi:Cu2+-containing amine oxidase